MDESEITHAILREIRDQLKATNAELARTREELLEKVAETNRRIDRTNRHLVNMESRLATEIGALRADLTETGPDRREFRERLERCERDIAELRERG
jgi:chromosome segregation ATPase